MRLEARAAAEPRATPELRPWGNAVDAREVAAATTLVILNNMLGCCGRPLLNKSMYEWDFAWALTYKERSPWRPETGDCYNACVCACLELGYLAAMLRMRARWPSCKACVAKLECLCCGQRATKDDIACGC